MMINEEQKYIIKIVDEFCDQHINEENVKLWCRSGGVPSAVYDAFYESELGGYALPVTFGGKDCSFLDRATMISALTRKAGATLPFQSDMLSLALVSAMRKLSQEEIAEELVPSTGRLLFSQAFTEPNAGTDQQGIRTTISADNDGIFLDGTKTFVSCGEFAPQTLVLARDPLFGQRDGGMSLWLVPIKAAGISTYPLNTVGQEMMCPAVVSFNHVKLEPHWQIQTEGRLDYMLRRQYGLGRIVLCASSLGLALAAMDDALAYAAEHKVKGRTLASLPQIQEKLADMEVQVRSMHMLVRAAAEATENDSGDFALKTSLMKRYVPKAATEVASEALQIFGGIGYTDATRVSRIWQDCRGNQIAQGTDEVMVGTIAKELVRRAQRYGWIR